MPVFRSSRIGSPGYLLADLADLGVVPGVGDEATISKAGPARDVHIGSSAHGIEGTPHYMSPEAVRGERPAASFDLWALGVVLFEAIAGVKPFEGGDARAVFSKVAEGRQPSLRDVLPSTPVAVDAMVARAFAPDPANRYQNAQTFGAEIRRLRESPSLG